MAQALRALSALLTYPEPPLRDAVAEIRQVLAASDLFDEGQLARFEPLLETLAKPDLIEAQEHYVEVFDRGRAHSLHLFEHIHGESRDRGQAMVDLRQRYLEAGLDPATGELPDYLPLFLEYCSVLPREDALAELAEPGAIIATLGERLATRDTPYAAVFSVLSEVVGASSADAVYVSPPDDPDDLAALDALWEEQEITFGAMAPSSDAGDACPQAQALVSRFLDPQHAAVPARSH
jgi:nitrate reductase delta subunit